LSTTECSVCKSIKPEIVNLFTAESEFRFLTVDCEVSSAISGQYLVFSVPTLILFFEGREFTRFSRFIRIADVESAMSHMRSLHESDDESITT